MSETTGALKRLARMRMDVASGEARRIRELVGVTQAEVAREAEISQATLSAWELGLRRPTGDEAARYAAVLDDLRRLVAKRPAVTEPPTSGVTPPATVTAETASA